MATENEILKAQIESLQQQLEGMKDITAPEIVQIVIRNDSKVIWINTEKGCIFRACKIKELEIDDMRVKK